jgi:5-methyltetrahydropteroyltriglutamate--homocysteine methyltransferase
VGEVSRPAPITVEWTTFAQSLTSRPVKGMLTGPMTMLLWSYPRDDLDLTDTCAQLALAIRDEVRNLEAADVGIVQVDEPALGEGLSLREEEHGAYLEWAVRFFRLATAGVADETQVHAHRRYAEFGEILPVIDALDADVISLEAVRSRMGVTGELARYGYERQVGPSVDDVHSPRAPTRTELAERIRAAAAYLPPAQLWVNPGCGLKTRSYDEVEPLLRAMVEAARQVRTELSSRPMLGERGSMESPPGPPA